MTKEPVKIFVNECILEITQRCNMCCDHCIRGKARDKDITPQVITQLLKAARIQNITFSGGEPALNVPAIRDYFRKAEKYDNFPSSFYVITNGTVNQRPLASALLDAYWKCEEPDMCGLVISEDIFHDVTRQDRQCFVGLSFYTEDNHSHPLDECMPDWVINDGNAAETGWGYRPPYRLTTNLDDIIEDISNDDNSIYIDQIYVTADGFVVSNCDASYERMDNEHICHISELQALARDRLNRLHAVSA